MRLDLAAALSLVGDNRAAAKLVGYDRLGVAALTSDWSGLAQTAQSMGPEYWDQYGFWNTISLLIAITETPSPASLRINA